MIQYICPGCRTEYRLESREKAGRIRCRVCRTPITTAELDKQEAIKAQINYLIQNQLEHPEPTPEESPESATSPVSTARADLYRSRRTRRGGRRFLLPLGIIGFLCVGAVAFAALKAGGNPLNAFYRTNPPKGSIRLDSTIIVEGELSNESRDAYHYHGLRVKLHGHNWMHMRLPKQMGYSVSIQSNDQDFVRKLTSNGGPKIVKIRGAVDHIGEYDQITLRNCVDLSDY